MKMKVLGRTTVVVEPDPGLLGIVERPVAEAGIGADRDRQDLEQQQKERRGGDQEQHEALLLAEQGTSPHFHP
jgi:hypothetical protein